MASPQPSLPQPSLPQPPSPQPEPVDLTRDLKELMQLAAADEDVDDLIRRGLDWLGRIVPYDLATVFDLEGRRLVARVARGPLAREVRRHVVDLDAFPSIRETLETRRARAFTEDDHAHGDGDPYDGLLDLPAGHSCMVIPLCAGDRCRGLLTLDRSVCEPYPDATVNLAEVYGQILAMALHAAEQQRTLGRLARQEHDRARLLEGRLAGDALGVLESSRSPAMQHVVRQARQVAATDTPVLLLGETGTGKERLARAVHLWSGRSDGAFVPVNCAALPKELLESELFGHAKGAFTGAHKDRPGRFQLANGGTLLLDEIGELHPDLQAKLLRVLQDGTFQPVGSDRTVKVDVRLVAATHVDLLEAVQAGRFREDLYYRLAVFPLRVPPLRERLEDLPRLCEVLLSEQAERTGRRGLVVTDAGHAHLGAYPWPGNLRELANVLERAAILARSSVLGAEAFDLRLPEGAVAFSAGRRGRSLGDGGGADAEPRNAEARAGLPGGTEPPGGRGRSSVRTLDEVQARYIAEVLEATGGRLYGEGGAAELLGLKPSTLQSRMKKLGVRRPG